MASHNDTNCPTDAGNDYYIPSLPPAAAARPWDGCRFSALYYPRRRQRASSNAGLCVPCSVPQPSTDDSLSIADPVALSDGGALTGADPPKPLALAGARSQRLH